ncbi:uncharacterized protein ARMOST_04210 [Armillaria ostoyae]|uniref:Heterokaryon incompatibility domain-containing protein n=1 Tax=Armillaria ostoyae TaxID=47428 RepID=A0A284QWQ9_ARMOS|nr:uncharacterized protein ARMOST_04210 [Armillaria ostoyae]
MPGRNVNLLDSTEEIEHIEHCCPNPLMVLRRPLTALRRCFCWPASSRLEDTAGCVHGDHDPLATSQSERLRKPISPSKTHPDAATVEFLSTVEKEFPNNPEVYMASSEILSDVQKLNDDCKEELHAILHRAQELFDEHVNLVLALNAFLPDGCQIECTPLALPRNTIHITSASDGGEQSILWDDALPEAASASSPPSRSSPLEGSLAQTGTLSRDLENPSGSQCDTGLGPDAPAKQVLSISEEFLGLMKIHFADTPEEYSQMVELVGNLKSGQISMLEALTQLAAVLWGCTYLIESLAACLPANQTLHCVTVFEMCNVFKLAYPLTPLDTPAINVPPDSEYDEIEDNPGSRPRYSAEIFLVLGNRVRRFRPCLSNSTPNTEPGDTLPGVPVIAVFESVEWLGGEHDGYPISHSWDEYFQRRRLVPLYSTRPSDSGNDALAQSWFTLGLLESVVEKKIPSKLMLDRTPIGDAVMSSNNLPLILRDWRRRMRALRRVDDHAFRQWFSRAEVALKELLEFLLTATRFPEKCIFRGPNYLPTLHMTAAIGEALMASMAEFQDLTRPMAGYVWSGAISRTKVARERLVPIHCQHATLQRQSVFDHSKCTRVGCSLNNIDPNVPYVNRHADDVCHCLYSKPPVDAVIQALTQNEIPVVIIEEPGSLRDTLDITCTTSSQSRYVAISHVWADGLGSTTEDGLPTCQLRRLSELTRRLLPQERGALWMDALCVPVVKEMRKRAIKLMAKTYKDAAVVLVLDAGIRSCSLDAPVEEKLLRILTSAWMQRLWTLQEALLAQKMFFELADSRLVSLEELIPWGEESCTMDGLKWLLLREMAPIVIFSQATPTEPVNHLFLHKTSFDLGTIGHALVKRTTSRKEDETLAIASLLGVDVSKLLDVSTHEERMKILLLELRFIPSGIIFSTGEKLTEPGFRWAPRSFLGQASPNTDRQALCTPNGLAGKYPWFYFDEITIEHNEMWLLRHRERGCCYLVEDGILDPSNYTCNGILLSSPINTLRSSSSPQSRNLVHAVAVTMATDRENCVYRRKVVLYLLAEHEVGHEQFQRKKVIDIQDSADLKIVFIT